MKVSKIMEDLFSLAEKREYSTEGDILKAGDKTEKFQKLLLQCFLP